MGWWLAVLALHGAAAGSQHAAGPNIILVMADDMGWSDLGCYGGEIRTPNVDSLARAGLRFTQFYNNSVCGPTRVSLLTGLYCQQVGHPGDRWNEPEDFTKCVTVAEVLQSVGYRTMMVGKWQERDLALDRGFDRFFGPMCQGKISYFHEVELNPYYLDRERWRAPEGFYLTDAINDFAVRFLQEAVRGDAPFFLYVAHIAPDWPLHARPADVAPYRRLYREQGWDQCRLRRFQRQRRLGVVPAAWPLSPRPAAVGDWAADPYQDWQAERMAVYAAQVDAIDVGLGRILQVVDEAGRTDNTVVMFLSDNGAAPDGGLAPSKTGFGFNPNTQNTPWRKDHVPIRPGSGPANLPGAHDTFAAYGLAWAAVSNTPLRGTKLTAYEGGIRTPLVVRWPAVIREGGRLTDQVGHVMDIMATCLDIAGAPYPRDFRGRKPLPLEGQSLLPVFQGRRRAGHEVLCWSVPQDHAIRMGRWKLVKPRTSEIWRLFDLEADGTETVDLAQRDPDRVRDLAQRFQEWRSRVGDAIDYAHPEKYLTPGLQTQMTEEESGQVARHLQFKQMDLTAIGKIYAWKESYFTNVRRGGRYVGTHTMHDLLNERVLTGCHDHGLVLVSILRKFGVPAVFVDATGIEWALQYPDKTQSFSGHVFVEAFLKNRWLLFDSTSGEYIADYDPSNPLIPIKKPPEPRGYYVMFKGSDPAEYGITRIQQLTDTQQRYARMIKAEIDRFSYPSYEVKRFSGAQQ